jgi:Flp pilus assembly protein TadB
MDRYFDLRPVDYFIKDLSALWWYYLLLGLLLILWGVAIVVWPQLLVAFVAALFILAGGTVLGLAWRVRRLQRRYQTFKRDLIGV